MKYVTLGARVVLGLIFTVFGLNGFFNFIPAPPSMPEKAMAFAGALAQSGYMFPMIKGTEVLVGVLLLTGYFVPLSLILLAPITVNIVLFHGILAPDGMAMPIAILILHLLLAYQNREAYRSVLKAK